MRKKAVLPLIIILLFALVKPVFCEIPMVEYLCEIGIAFYRMGRYDDALLEFKKVLIIDPRNQTAANYINNIFKQGMPAPTPKAEVISIPPEKIVKVPEKIPTREEAMDIALNNLSKKRLQEELERETKVGKEIAGLKIKGDMQLSLGVTPQNTIWKRANYDLNERNWRMLSDAAYNQRFNTYDPRIYDRLSIDLDTDNKEGLNFHSNINVDPWSFTGKSEKITITGAWGDTGEVELKYWSNTGYTIHDSVYTLRDGDAFSLPELKVTDARTSPLTITSIWGDTFAIPALKIQREFQPVRELWLDYVQDGFNMRLFPIAYQDQAFSSDDPLGITNHHMWWENSFWLRQYKHGNYNFGAGALDFTKGYWDNYLTFLSRDSSGAFLTGLRGFSFRFEPQDGSYLATTVATPKDLWQEYTDVDNIISATRLKHKLTDNFSLGSTVTTRSGFNLDESTETDSRNFVGGVDFGYEFLKGVKTSFEVLASHSDYDLTNSDYKTESRGNAYYFSICARFPRKSIMDLVYGYDEIKLDKDESFLLKAQVFACHMDGGFDSALSSYRNTRNDAFWSRHIYFRKPFDYYYAGLHYPSLKWDDISPTRIGTGIDIGRDALGFRVETIFKDKFNNLFDVRNVHDIDGKYIETVARDETTVKINDKLTLKALGIYQDLPKTKGGIDPFLFDADTGEYAADWSTDPIDDGKDPSLKTGSLGLEYSLFDWLSISGIWERTNDYTLAYGNFPRSVFNSGQPSDIYYENGLKYRRDIYYIYDQQLFPQPPYPFYDIFKSGLTIRPTDKLDIYLDYTRNEFAIAGQNSDNMNHVGMEITYTPTKKFGLALIYTYSRWKDLDRLRAGLTETIGHHNIFTEFRYLRTKDDEFILQYGEGARSPIGSVTFDPFGGSLLSIDTRHIIRAYYRRTF